MVNVPSLNSITITESIFYDNYSFLSLPEFQARALRYTEETGYGRMYGSTGENIAHKGLMTGRMLCKEGSEGYVCEAYYYDSRKRIVQTRKVTHNGSEQSHLARYAYTGEVEEELTTVSPRNAFAADSIHTMRLFDRHGRLVKEAVEVNGSLPAVRKLSYDGIGRLEHIETGVFGNVASSEYGFNVRGWQTETNSKSVTGDTLFASELRYCSDLECPDSTPLYGGEISEWVFTDGTGTVRTYSLAYGKTGKLKDALLYSDGIPDNSFAETGMKYDKNGNMTAIVRSNASLPQSLSLTYDGNRLVGVSLPSGESGKYSYDSCGNMTYDGLHGLDISYNRLNLPETISENGSTIVKYDYLWDGTKIRTMTDSGKGMEYYGPMTYRVDGDNFRLDEARLPWVRFVRTAKTDGEDIEPVYIFRDHLGSVRAMVTADSALTEKDSYLPFGIRWNEDATSDKNNRYRFNSKEEQAFAGLPYIDFGARLYDPAIARWLTPDPLAEKYYSVSPYTFCNDDPINYIDPDGRHVEVTKSKDGSYVVSGGKANEDQYIYENYGMKNQHIIGKMLTQYSFMDDDGNAVKGAVIDLFDQSGEEFLSNLMNQPPTLIHYMFNAVGGEIYDFKTNGTVKGDDNYYNSLYHYRGMIISIDNNKFIASARDIGNFAAGYIAGKNDLPWAVARLGFDALETWQHIWRQHKYGFFIEGNPTQYAQKTGFDVGRVTDAAKAIRKAKLYRPTYPKSIW